MLGEESSWGSQDRPSTWGGTLTASRRVGRATESSRAAKFSAQYAPQLFAEGDGMLAHFNRAAAMRILQQAPRALGRAPSGAARPCGESRTGRRRRPGRKGLHGFLPPFSLRVLSPLLLGGSPCPLSIAFILLGSRPSVCLEGFARALVQATSALQVGLVDRARSTCAQVSTLGPPLFDLWKSKVWAGDGRNRELLPDTQVF